jgi:hypothetical protein
VERLRKMVLVTLALVFASGFVSGCFRRTFVVVPQREGGYGARDTLYGRADGGNVRVTFRHDTTWRVDTITIHRTDTLWRGGTRIIRDTVVRRDTTIIPTAVPIRRDTIFLPDPRRGRDTVYLPARGTRRDTVIRRDTIYLPRAGGAGRVDTLRLVTRDTIYLPRVGGAPARVDTVRVTVRDTLRLTVRDTLRITVRDTLRLTVRDTVRVSGSAWRTIHIPPGHFPPDGQCRVWIADRPPGRQADAAACDQLGPIPAGAFVLFGGAAYDFDHDWVAESSRLSVPVQIVALKRRSGR